MIGAGNPKTIEVILIISVLDRILAKSGVLNKYLKFSRPTHGLPIIHNPGENCLKAIIAPYIGL